MKRSEMPFFCTWIWFDRCRNGYGQTDGRTDLSALVLLHEQVSMLGRILMIHITERYHLLVNPIDHICKLMTNHKQSLDVALKSEKKKDPLPGPWVGWKKSSSGKRNWREKRMDTVFTVSGELAFDTKFCKSILTMFLITQWAKTLYVYSGEAMLLRFGISRDCSIHSLFLRNHICLVTLINFKKGK